ncbi:MAG: response regulator transcription factor [Crocinitomicaceae bacterium]|nr:response regulator transcription factor [Crocinitomicaceae bacterium]
MKKILLVDDEKDIRRIIAYNLEKEGFQIFEAKSGKEALGIVSKEFPDLIILDVMMPEMDGIEFCQELRSNPEFDKISICFLTARNEDYSQIAGLEAGGDDYISKPIKPKVLIARIKAILRRSNASDSAKSHSKVIEVDTEKYQVKFNGELVNLPKKEFELLALLYSQPNKVFERRYILSSVWGDDVIVSDRTIDVHIRKLREKFGSKYFVTLKGVGYKYVD